MIVPSAIIRKNDTKELMSVNWQFGVESSKQEPREKDGR